MSELHPHLRLRPRSPAGMRRPTLQHPDLGTLAYINRDGGWWQGTATIAGTSVRLDLQQPANVPEGATNTAATFLRWVQENETVMRAHIGRQLASGDFNFHALRSHQGAAPKIPDDPAISRGLRPCMIVLWADSADLRYDFDSLPEGNLLGAHELEVSVSSDYSVQLRTLYERDLHQRSERFLERPLPHDAVDFENSIGDQFIAKAAETWSMRLDPELKSLLEKAIADTDKAIEGSSAERASYFRSANLLLSEIARTPQTVVVNVFVHLVVGHPAGKRLPFKQKLVFAPTDRARFEDGRVRFAFHGPLVPSEAFTAAQQEHLKEVAHWLAKQSPAVFHDLRAAGARTSIFIHLQARMESQDVEVQLPSEFLAECARLGLAASVSTSSLGRED